MSTKTVLKEENKAMDMNKKRKGALKYRELQSTDRHFINCKEVWKESGEPSVLIILSGRSSGKSTSMSNWLIENWVENHKKFILISRDLLKAQNKNESYFGEEYKDIIRYENKSGYGMFYYKDEPMGFNVALTLVGTYKSNTLFSDSDINLMVFEEFVEVSPDYYLTNEVSMLNNIASTVFRNRTDGTIVLLGNNLNESSKYNPYFTDWLGKTFDEFDIKQGESKEVYQNHYTRVVLHYGGMGYTDESQIGFVGFLPNNEVALSGRFEPDPFIIGDNPELSLESFIPQADSMPILSSKGLIYLTHCMYGENTTIVISDEPLQAPEELTPVVLGSTYDYEQHLSSRVSGSSVYYSSGLVAFRVLDIRRAYTEGKIDTVELNRYRAQYKEEVAEKLRLEVFNESFYFDYDRPSSELLQDSIQGLYESALENSPMYMPDEGIWAYIKLWFSDKYLAICKGDRVLAEWLRAEVEYMFA